MATAGMSAIIRQAKDEWNTFVKNNAHQTREWWLDHYKIRLAKSGGLTAREWDHYGKIEKEKP
jgi:hypothetical protein